MKAKTAFLMITIALVLGLGAAWMANEWVTSRLALADETKPDGVTVVVAAVQIPFGHRIEEADVRTVVMPKEVIPAGSFKATEEVVGQVATQTMYPGEPLLEGRMREHLGGSTLAAVINPGNRAVTVRVNDVVGVAGFLLPGNRVDVLATRKDRQGVEAETLLQDVRVLAVDQTASPDKNQPVIVRAVTLELNPEQAESLVKATQEGTVQLALRNPLEKAPQPVARATPQSPAPPPVAQATPQVTVIKGTSALREKVAF